MKVQTIERDGKPEYAILPWSEYQALLGAMENAVDVALLETFRQQLETGEEETVPATVLEALLAGFNPLKVWREYRGLTQEVLASHSGISKAYLCQLETGKRQGSIKTLSAIASALGVTIDDLEK